MSWSLRVSNGDLSIGTSGLNTVGGASKLVQDLTCDILEPMGTDDMHPTYGTLIDGGTDPNGNVVPGVIGTPNDANTASYVRNELQRVGRNYQAQQIARNNADVLVYGKSTLTADEALLTVESVNVQQIMNQMLVNMALQTGTGNVNLTIPLSPA